MNLDERWFQGHLMEMSRSECLEALATRPVGRVAYSDADGPVVTPVNFALDGEDVLFRIASWTSLARGLHGRVAFQVDDFEEYTQSGWSVLVRGQVSFIDHDSSGPGPAVNRPTPWAEGRRDLLVRLSPTQVTGRRLIAA
ncbi:pyridoxamine 5'-phosphate oxidase family protein [Nocardioides sp.]|uniref:pyridoxamine 5'-phosphate oxidase family protein n=1 Tax=Nocardioides sp. TaxID=35761 RepID=UPI003D11D682